MTLAIIVPQPTNDNKFACVVGNEVIGASKHSDYFEHHFKRNDLKGLKDRTVSKFVHVTGTGKIESIQEVGTLKGRKSKNAQLPVIELTDAEKTEVREALKAARAAEKDLANAAKKAVTVAAKEPVAAGA